MKEELIPCQGMTALTDAWYNTLASNLNLSGNNFQLVQPLQIPKDDRSLWNNFNCIPPATLKYNRWYSDQPDFFSQYAAVVNQLSLPESTFREDIGVATYIEWQVYLDTLPTPPPANELPTIWFKWAIMNAPNVANIGRSDLACQVLINSGKQALSPYLGQNAKPVDFQPKYLDLINTLRASPSVSFSFDSVHDNPNVVNSWVPGCGPNLFGMWTGTWCGFQISRKFAASAISVFVNIKHFSVMQITPGSWYDSSLLHLALVSKSCPPWTRDPIENWDKYFGNDGKFKYAIGSAIVADGISLVLESNADFTLSEQSIIKKQVEMGYWPLYCLQESSTIDTTVTFEPGKLKIMIQSASGNPIIMGNNVMSINSYLGGT